MQKEHESLIAEIISTYEEASQMLSDYYYGCDDDEGVWWAQWRSREFRAATDVVESLVHEDSFASKHARKIVSDSLEWYRDFLQVRGYEFKCMKLDILIEKVGNADIGEPESSAIHPRR